MTLEQLRVLVSVVRSGSFTRAAEALGTQKSYVSRVVTQLEAELGVRLLERTTRTLAVTETGREVVERATGILGAVDDTVRLVQSTQAAPRGVLRLTCGVEFGLLAVGRWIEELLALHPQVTVDVEYSSRVIDLVHEGFDLAVRVGPVRESRLVARRLGQLDYALYACPRYLAAQGTPRTLDELRAHSLVMFARGTARHGWQLRPVGGAERDAVRLDAPARLRVNNSHAVRDALLCSLGIGPLPLLIAADGVAAGRLVPVLSDWRPPPVEVHALYPSNRFLNPKVRAFVDLALLRFPLAHEHARQVTERACTTTESAAMPARRGRRRFSRRAGRRASGAAAARCRPR